MDIGGDLVIDNEDIYYKLVSSSNLADAHFKVILDNQNLILKNQEKLSKQLADISSKLDKILE